MDDFPNIILLISSILNLIGVYFTVGSKLTSKSFRIDGGNISDPNSGFIEMDLGASYQRGRKILFVGICAQIIGTLLLVLRIQ